MVRWRKRLAVAAVLLSVLALTGTAPEAVRGQPKNWQAALVAVQPGTGRVAERIGDDQPG